MFASQAKYLKHRRTIVDWMCEVGEEYHLSALTIHCAVRYLDRLLGEADVPKNQLQLVAMACILVASKYEEAEDVIPTLIELNECSNNAYSLDSIKEMEVCVLRSLNWCLTIINPIHFLHYFLASGIVHENDVSFIHHTRTLYVARALPQFEMQRAVCSICFCAVVTPLSNSREVLRTVAVR